VPRNALLPHQTLIERPVETRLQGSSLHASYRVCLYFFPRNHIIRIRLMVGETPIQLDFLSLRQGRSRIRCCDAVPDGFHELDALFDAKFPSLIQELGVHEP